MSTTESSNPINLQQFHIAGVLDTQSIRNFQKPYKQGEVAIYPQQVNPEYSILTGDPVFSRTGYRQANGKPYVISCFNGASLPLNQIVGYYGSTNATRARNALKDKYKYVGIAYSDCKYEDIKGMGAREPVIVIGGTVKVINLSGDRILPGAHICVRFPHPSQPIKNPFNTNGYARDTIKAQYVSMNMLEYLPTADVLRNSLQLDVEKEQNSVAVPDTINEAELHNAWRNFMLSCGFLAHMLELAEEDDITAQQIDAALNKFGIRPNAPARVVSEAQARRLNRPKLAGMSFSKALLDLALGGSVTEIPPTLPNYAKEFVANSFVHLQASISSATTDVLDNYVGKTMSGAEPGQHMDVVMRG